MKSMLALLALLAWMLFLAISCPYTKVEESFNMQGIHDFLYHGTNLHLYDHLEFPGVVPRTFWGVLIVAITSKPIQMLFNFADSQVLVRIAMVMLLWCSHYYFQLGVVQKFGQRVATLTTLLLSIQFHMPFYMSRTLPNTFALAACNIVFGLWLRGEHQGALLVLGSSMVIFRCDLLLLLAPLALQFLFMGKVSFWHTLGAGAACCIAALMATIALDSLLWGRWLWPEGVVLLFNNPTGRNMSSHWGVEPWHWYWTSALPRSLHASLPLVVVGLLGIQRPPESQSGDVTCAMGDNRSSSSSPRQEDGLLAEMGVCLCARGPDTILLEIAAPAFAYVALYSILPHKELRFLFPVLPILTLAAAVGLDRLLPQRQASNSPAPVQTPTPSSPLSPRKRQARYLIAFLLNCALAVLLAVGLAANSLFWASAVRNYPGGQALKMLVEKHIPDSALSRKGVCSVPIGGKCRASAAGSTGTCSDEGLALSESVHIGVDAAMSGVTRFGQRKTVRVPCPESEQRVVTVLYSKTERLSPAQLGQFDWLLISPDEAAAAGLSGAGANAMFDVVESVRSFRRLVKKLPGDGAESHRVPLWGLPFSIEMAPAVLVLRRKGKV